MKFLIESFLDFLINTHPSNPILLLLLCSKSILVSVPITLMKRKRHLLQIGKAVFFTVTVKLTSSHSESYAGRKNEQEEA
jgi:hypothetical protein